MVDDHDVINELRSGTQGKGENISPYLKSLRLIMGQLKRPLDKNKQAQIAYKGLISEYRRQLDWLYFGIEKILLYFEKAKDLDDCHVPPPAKNKMRFPSAAYIEAVEKGVDKSTRIDKVAALENESESNGRDHSSEKKKNKKNKMEKSNKEAECGNSKTASNPYH